MLALLLDALAGGCASLNQSMPAEAYAKQQASEADLVAFFAQGGSMDPRFKQLRNGMPKKEVIHLLGEPDRIEADFDSEGSPEKLVYLGRFPSGWAWDRADYEVELRDDKVVRFSKGPVTRQPPPKRPPFGL